LKLFEINLHYYLPLFGYYLWFLFDYYLWSLFGYYLCSLFLMVRTYKRKTSLPVYTEEDLKNAIQHIQVEKWSYRRASTCFNIPLTLSIPTFSCVLHQL